MKKIYFYTLLILLAIITSGCSGKQSIKNDFCGIHINYQYCKCAFHEQYCQNIGMTKSEAKEYVYSQYNSWLEEQSNKTMYGVVERDGNLYINSKPGEILSIKTEDLPAWARGKIATVGATVSVVGPPDTISEGDKNVLLDGHPISRVNDSTVQGGVIVEGSKNIFVNGKPVAIIGGSTVNPMISRAGVPYVGGPILANAK